MNYNNFSMNDINNLPYSEFDIYYILIKNRIEKENEE